MKRHSVGNLNIERGLAALSLLLGFGLQAGCAWAGGNLNPDADEILRSMSKSPAGTKAFSVAADMSTDVVTVEQQKLQFNGHADRVIERPLHL